MTGFGKSEIAIDGRKLRVEIKTVNHRFLDISNPGTAFHGLFGGRGTKVC